MTGVASLFLALLFLALLPRVASISRVAVLPDSPPIAFLSTDVAFLDGLALLPPFLTRPDLTHDLASVSRSTVALLSGVSRS